MACSGCGASVGEEARFCTACGQPVGVGCEGCGAPLPPDARFCAQCGRAVAHNTPGAGAPTSERRLASVLFADLVGFTSLSEHRDPEETRELLSGYFDKCRTVVDRYGGTVEKFIGDAVMAVWGVPSAHGDDAERAVRAGLELVESVEMFGQEIGGPGLTVRVGVVTGEVAVTLGAVGEGLVAGDAVNTAARVQSVAEPGQVWVDDQTRSFTSASIRYADCGSHELKGRTRPAHLFNAVAVVAGVGGVGTPGYIEVPLVGYQQELSLIKAQFQAAADETRGRLLLLTGDPGVGKSRLSIEFENYIDGLSRSVRWHRGRCLAYGEGIAFSALVGAVRGRIGADDQDAEASVSRKLDESLVTYVPDEDERAWLGPRLGVLLGLSDRQFAREDLFPAWLTWFEHLGEGAEGVVWVVDDAHLADEALLDFLEYAVRSATFSLFVLVLARTELLEQRPQLGVGRRKTSQHLDGLSDEAMRTLLDALLEDLTPSTRAVLTAHAAGLPLYAIETVRALSDRGLAVPVADGGRRLLPDVDEGALVDASASPSLQVLITSRLDLLGADVRDLLQSAAILGMTFSAPDLTDMPGVPPERVEAGLASLVERDLLHVVRDPLAAEDGQYTFVQSVVRQVASQTLGRRDRMRRHLAVAEGLSARSSGDGELASVVAQHLVEAYELADEAERAELELLDRRSHWLRRSAERARSLGAPAEALRAYEQALEGVTERATLDELHEKAAQEATEVGRRDLALAHALEVSSAKPGLAASAARYAVLSLCGEGRHDEAEELLVTLGDVSTLGEVDALAASWAAFAHSYLEMDLFHPEKSERWAQTAVKYAERSGDPETLVASMNILGVASLSCGMPNVGRALVAATVELSRRHQLSRRLGTALVNQASDYLTFDPRQAVAVGREALDFSARTGGVTIQAVAETNLMLALRAVGSWDDALVVWQDGLAAQNPSAAIANLRDFAPNGAIAGLIRIARGEPPDIPAAWTDQVLSEVTSDSPGYTTMLIAARRYDAGDRRAAAELAADAAAMCQRSRDIHEDFAFFWVAAVEWALAVGRPDLARVTFALLGGMAPRHFEPVLAGEFLRMRGSVAASEPDAMPDVDVEDDLRRSIDAADGVGMVPARARGQASLGQWLALQGRDEEARPLMNEAQAAFELLGAKAWLVEFGLVGDASSAEAQPPA